MKKTAILFAFLTASICGLKAQPWLTNGTNVYYNGGNVGIGTTTPDFQLSVYANAQAGIKVTSTTDWASFRLKGADNTEWALLANYPNTSDFTIREVGIANRMTIKKTTGYIGIGTATPSYPLHIDTPMSDASVTVLKLCHRSARLKNAAIIELGANDPVAGYVKIMGYSNTWNTYNSQFEVQTYCGAENAWKTGLYQNEIGNVGIGTTTPDGLLTIGENNQKLNFLSNKKLTGGWPPVADNNTYTIQSTGYYIGNLAFAVGNTEIMRIASNGSVGIGTTKPTNKLQVVGNAAIGQYTNGTAVIDAFDGNAYYGCNSATNGLSIGTTGNVGIGTTTPSYPLHINTPMTDANATVLKLCHRSARLKEAAIIELGDNDPMAGYVKIMGYSDTWTTFNSQFEVQTYCHAENSWKTGLYQSELGNVGIGTTKTPYKLTVEGTIGAREVKVTTETWSDFVFHPTYKLRTLGEVEQFIKTNRHLPDVPTAAEVKANGVSLGEMNAKLLQKVEELTLYLIEQQKQINELKEQNSSFAKKIETLDN